MGKEEWEVTEILTLSVLLGNTVLVSQKMTNPFLSLPRV